jgi:hypothetical protein
MFKHVGDVIVMEATGQEVAFLGQIPSLLDTVGTVDGDQGYAVLHRRLCLDDDDVDREMQALVSPEIDAQRRHDRESFMRCLRNRSAISFDDAHGFLRSLNAARLVLAARAGAFNEGVVWEDRIDQDPNLAAVAWLGYVQGELIKAVNT